jgi:hypothetical protein
MLCSNEFPKSSPNLSLLHQPLKAFERRSVPPLACIVADLFEGSGKRSKGRGKSVRGFGKLPQELVSSQQQGLLSFLGTTDDPILSHVRVPATQAMRL